MLYSYAVRSLALKIVININPALEKTKLFRDIKHILMMDLFSTHTSENPIFLRLLVLFMQETERNVPTQRPISKVRENICLYLSFRLYILQRRAYL